MPPPPKVRPLTNGDNREHLTHFYWPRERKDQQRNKIWRHGLDRRDCALRLLVDRTMQYLNLNTWLIAEYISLSNGKFKSSPKPKSNKYRSARIDGRYLAIHWGHMVTFLDSLHISPLLLA